MELPDLTDFSRPLYDDRPTPWLEIDKQRLDRNLMTMQHKAERAGARLRPHVKTHKSIAIAQRQLALGAVGITVAKPEEAMVFIQGGVRDLMLAYPVVTPGTLAPLLALAAEHQARLTLIAASLMGVEAIATAAQAQPDCQLAVAIKVDVGLGRVGVQAESDDGLHLAASIAQHQLRFAGLVAHAGHAYGAENLSAITAIAAHEMQQLRLLQQRLATAGFNYCPLSVGATPTALGAPIAAATDELRPGNYALLDLTALRLGLCDADALAMTVVARVVATNARYAILDAGSKALSSDRGPHGTNAVGFGLAVNATQGFWIEKLSEEHAFVPHQGVIPTLGSLMRIFPNHACAVMAQFDRAVLRDEDGQAEIIPIEARGKFC